MPPDIRTILFAAGLGNDTGYVLAYALSIAQKYGARIHIIHSHEALNITAQSMAELYMFQEGLDDAFEKSLQDTEAKLTVNLEEIIQSELKKSSAGRDLIASIQISRQPPKQAILDATEEFKADLIVMGSHRHSVLTDALLGSTTMKILHSTKVPVFVVRIPKEIPKC